jgi:hypothetical protein
MLSIVLQMVSDARKRRENVLSIVAVNMQKYGRYKVTAAELEHTCEGGNHRKRSESQAVLEAVSSSVKNFEPTSNARHYDTKQLKQMASNEGVTVSKSVANRVIAGKARTSV